MLFQMFFISFRSFTFVMFKLVFNLFVFFLFLFYNILGSFHGQVGISLIRSKKLFRVVCFKLCTGCLRSFSCSLCCFSFLSAVFFGS